MLARRVPRQVWLAGLGAAVVTRDWARNEAGQAFRALVREGSTVESRAMRVIGTQINTSIAMTRHALNKSRNTTLAAVNGLVDSAVAMLPRLRVAVAANAPAPVKAKAAKRRVARKSRRGKRLASKV
ncbi:MAG TPA: phasin family protein [Casimicrobiaceae bacterium]